MLSTFLCIISIFTENNTYLKDLKFSDDYNYYYIITIENLKSKLETDRVPKKSDFRVIHRISQKMGLKVKLKTRLFFIFCQIFLHQMKKKALFNLLFKTHFSPWHFQNPKFWIPDPSL